MKKQIVELAAGLECGIFATKKNVKEAFDYVNTIATSFGTQANAIHTVAHVLANTIAADLRKLAITPASDNKRQAVMVELMDYLDEEFNSYEEGLTTDLECVRKMYLEIDQAFQLLDVCTVCGCANDGNHFETYGGNVCTSCNPDQRVFTVSYGRGFPVTPPVLKYRHQMIRFEGMDIDDEERMDSLNPGEMSDVYLDGDRRFHIMRTR